MLMVLVGIMVSPSVLLLIGGVASVAEKVVKSKLFE